MSSYFEKLLLINDELSKVHEFGGLLDVEINQHLVSCETPEEYLMDLRFSSENPPSLDEINNIKKCNEENKIIEVRVCPDRAGSCFHKFGTNLEDICKEMIETLIATNTIDESYKVLERS